MPQAQVLAETRTISLDAGKKMLVVGANEAGIAKFRVAGEDRYEFMNVGQVKQTSSLHGKNTQFVLVNGRIPTDVQEQVETLADRAGSEAVYVCEDSAALQQTMQDFPVRVKGVATFVVHGVLRVVELRTPTPVRLQPKASAPPKPPDPPVTTAPSGVSKPADLPPVQQSQPKTATLVEVLDGLEQTYSQFGGDCKKVIARVRALGFDESKISRGALYQRCLTIRKRKEKLNGRGLAVGVTVPAELTASTAGTELLKAIEAAKTSEGQMIRLAAEVAAENERLKALVAQQAQQLEGLPTLVAEAADLRRKVETAKKHLAEAANQL